MIRAGESHAMAVASPPGPPNAEPAALTGRLTSAPDQLLHDEVLEPQFRHEAGRLLTSYVLVEKVLLLEYQRMDLVSVEEGAHIAAALDDVTADDLAADPAGNLSDILFALERFVVARVPVPVPRWHVDRSRNDMQACAQLLFGRAQLLETAETMLACARSAHRLAARHPAELMPGYTHLQPAQAITTGFYVTALCAHLLRTLRRLLATYDGIDRSPLGAAAMAGPELPWDRDRMARLLGFAAVEPHPLVAVASRAWVLELAAECSTFGVVLSRFVTDLMAWGSGAYQFLDLPDALAGISSAMPQKKNFPILERIRGRAAHLTSWYVDVAFTQRATAFANSVEVSKEGGQLLEPLATLRSALRLLTVVLDHLVFRSDRMRQACEQEYLGGFSLANLLTLRAGLPWRTAQVVAGRYVVAAQRDHLPSQTDPTLLRRVASEYGYSVADAGELLTDAFDPEGGVRRKQPSGSTHPVAVHELLDVQARDLAGIEEAWRDHRASAEAAPIEVDRLLGLRRATDATTDSGDSRMAADAVTLFSTVVRQCPDADVVSFGSHRLSFVDLEIRANRLANGLIALGVRPGDAVAVLVGPSIAQVVATLAVVKSGAAYVPLTVDQPPARVRLMLAEASARVLLVDDEHLAAAPVTTERTHGTTIAMVALAEQSGASSADPGVTVEPASLAYIIFTSGSTGRPKGVAVTHANLVTMVTDPSWRLANQQRVLLHSSYAFDASVYEMWLPMLTGGAIVIAEDDAKDPFDLVDTIGRRGVTAAYFTAALFHLLVEHCLDGLAALREIWVGGDVVSAPAVQRFLDHCPDTALVHVYGPTETTLWCSYQRFDPEGGRTARLQLGEPMARTRMYVLDSDLRPVPERGAGELYVGGVRLARGYAGRPSLTAERFLPDPHGPPGERMYRTGDLVRRDDDELTFLGRVDNQVKVRGYRIELGEIRRALALHPAVGDCAVTVHDLGDGQLELAAYLTVAAGAARPGRDAIAGHLADLLPGYMIPATVTVLDAMPLTPNGKVDRSALPIPRRRTAPSRPAGPIPT